MLVENTYEAPKIYTDIRILENFRFFLLLGETDRENSVIKEFHKSVRDALHEKKAPRFFGHESLRTDDDRENLVLWEQLQNRCFNPAGKNKGRLSGDELFLMRTIRPHSFYQSRECFGGDCMQYFFRMPYASLTLAHLASAQLFGTSARSIALIFDVPADNILAASPGCLGSGYAHEYLNRDQQDFIFALKHGVSSPDQCLSRDRGLGACCISNEIVVQAEIPGKTACKIRGGVIIENRAEHEEWGAESRDFYQTAREKGLAVARIWEETP